MGCYSLQVVLAVQKDLSAFNFSMDTNDATWQQVFFFAPKSPVIHHTLLVHQLL